MPVSVRMRLGSYEIIAPLGAGGMGEVYRARDTKLDRAVAIKIQPDSFAHDPERLARFEREAKTLAALNHPNIATIHGFDEAQGIQLLVMELVEGPTLADVIAARGGGAPRGLELEEALPIARQIADALEAAHEQGIVHRDLKPANIKLRGDGTVKVLDFGLAKAIESAVPGNAAASPTITSPALMTGAGIILGTAAYMSPEQAKGRAADQRSDVWAFGCVLRSAVSKGRRARVNFHRWRRLAAMAAGREGALLHKGRRYADRRCDHPGGIVGRCRRGQTAVPGAIQRWRVSIRGRSRRTFPDQPIWGRRNACDDLAHRQLARTAQE